MIRRRGMKNKTAKNRAKNREKAKYFVFRLTSSAINGKIIDGGLQNRRKNKLL